MGAKHLIKNSILYKYLFLLLAMVVSAILCVLFYSALYFSEANALEQSENQNGNIFITIDEETGITPNIVWESEWLEIGSEFEAYSYYDWENKDDVINRSRGIPVTKIALGQVEPTTNANYNSLEVFLFDNEGYMKIVDYWVKGEPILRNNNTIPIWTLSNLNEVPVIKSGDYRRALLINDLSKPLNFLFTDKVINVGADVSGVVTDASNVWQPVPGAFVQYYHRTLWGDIPVPEMSTFTDWFGHYTIEGIEDDMLPGIIKVYRWGYEVGESAPIWFVPEGLDTIYRFVDMVPSEPPVPPVPPTPPDPPVPPQPDPPQPVPPTPVPPTPTPVDPGGNIAQTSDSAGLALVIAGMLALCGACAFGACAKRRKFDK